MSKDKYIMAAALVIIAVLCCFLPVLVFGQIYAQDNSDNIFDHYDKPGEESVYIEPETEEAYPWSLYVESSLTDGDMYIDGVQEYLIPFICEFVGRMQEDTILSCDDLETKIKIDAYNGIIFIKGADFHSEAGKIYNADISISGSGVISYRINNDKLISHEEYTRAYEYIDEQCKQAMRDFASGKLLAGPFYTLFEKLYGYTDMNIMYYLLESYYSINYSKNYLIIEFVNYSGENKELDSIARLYYDVDQENFTGFDINLPQ